MSLYTSRIHVGGGLGVRAALRAWWWDSATVAILGSVSQEFDRLDEARKTVNEDRAVAAIAATRPSRANDLHEDGEFRAAPKSRAEARRPCQ